MNRNLIMLATAVLVAAFLLSTSGCQSIGARSNLPPENHYPYMGVAADLDLIWNPCLGHMLAPMGIIDLPFSLVVDTVLLPVDLIHVLEKDKESE